MAWLFTGVLVLLLVAEVSLAVKKHWAYVIPIASIIISLGAISFTWRSEAPGEEFIGIRRDIFGESHGVIQGWEQAKLLPWQYISPRRISFSESRTISEREAQISVVCYYFQGQAELMIKEGEQLFDPKECVNRTFEIYQQEDIELHELENRIRKEFPGILVWISHDRVVVF